jgi:hypothetical protein
MSDMAEFTQTPFPGLCVMAVYIVLWSYMIVGSFALQPCHGFNSEGVYTEKAKSKASVFGKYLLWGNRDSQYLDG